MYVNMSEFLKLFLFLKLKFLSWVAQFNYLMQIQRDSHSTYAYEIQEVGFEIAPLWSESNQEHIILEEHCQTSTLS